jgi:VacB/RNase II family 3'-5' exoribonuclease
MAPRDLRSRAHDLMLEAGFEPEFPPAALAEAARAEPPATGSPTAADGARDLRDLLWSSIDNPESRDLDQLEWAEPLGDGRARLRVAISDVDAQAPAGSAIDRHAAANTTSVYTGIATFPMIPERLSTDLTSLHQGRDRLAIVLDVVVDATGDVRDAAVTRALVCNRARLAYPEVGRWLEGGGPPPPAVAASGDLQAQLRLQAQIGGWLRARRRERGALELETIEARPVSDGQQITGLELVRKNAARDLIEDIMLATNSALAQLCESRNISWIRRIVRSPSRWQRLVTLAASHGETLPAEPSGPALAGFLTRRRAAAPESFTELSLAVVKLIGAGEYAVEHSGEDLAGHFGLAVDHYTHATAPNRRYADLITQRLVKAAVAGNPAPYSDADLEAIALQCTRKEDDARKVERQLRKLGAASLLAPRVGERFQAIVTGVTSKGVFARLLAPPAEGRVVRGEQGLDVGDRIDVRLQAVDPDRGFIDFTVS